VQAHIPEHDIGSGVGARGLHLREGAGRDDDEAASLLREGSGERTPGERVLGDQGETDG
jgi:hypothetical protein